MYIVVEYDKIINPKIFNSLLEAENYKNEREKELISEKILLPRYRQLLFISLEDFAEYCYDLGCDWCSKETEDY